MRVTPSSTESIVFFNVSKSSCSSRPLLRESVFVAKTTETFSIPSIFVIASSIFIAQFAQSRPSRVYFLVIVLIIKFPFFFLKYGLNQVHKFSVCAHHQVNRKMIYHHALPLQD